MCNHYHHFHLVWCKSVHISKYLQISCFLGNVGKKIVVDHLYIFWVVFWCPQVLWFVPCISLVEFILARICPDKLVTLYQLDLRLVLCRWISNVVSWRAGGFCLWWHKLCQAHQICERHLGWTCYHWSSFQEYRVQSVLETIFRQLAIREFPLCLVRHCSTSKFPNNPGGVNKRIADIPS